MTEFSWLLSLILIVPLKSMKITCQLFWSGKHLAVSVQWDTVLIVQDLFWSSWGASVRAALFSQMPVLPPRKSPARQRKLDCICLWPRCYWATGYSCFTSLFYFCFWDWRQRQRRARGTLTRQRDHEAWEVQLCSCLTDPVLSGGHRHKTTFGNIPVVKGWKGRTQEWEVSQTWQGHEWKGEQLSWTQPNLYCLVSTPGLYFLSQSRTR